MGSALALMEQNSLARHHPLTLPVSPAGKFTFALEGNLVSLLSAAAYY